MKVFTAILTLKAFWLVKCEEKRQVSVEPPQRIAVIGAGIGGSSATYFLRKQFGQDVEIDLYEQETRLGGRLATVTLGGREYESGGSIIHPKNMYMKSFVETFPGLEKAPDFSGTLGIFDGKDYVFRGSKWSLITLLKMFWTFGFDLLRLQWVENKFMKKFLGIYDLQEQGQSFDNVASLLSAMGGDEFVQATRVTAEDLFSSKGISDFTIRNLVNPGLNTNYGQNASVNGFVGAVSMAGIQSGLWSVQGGNKRVCEELVANSSVNLIHERVTSVKFSKSAQSQKFAVFSEERAENPRSYDIVIVATPIESDMSHINLTEACSDDVTCPTAQPSGKKYRRTVASYVHGKLSSKLFQCDSLDDCPSGIMLTNQDKFYRSIGLHVPVDYDPKTDKVEPIYKVFSTTPMSEEQWKYLFDSYNETVVVDWKAYPFYRPPEKLTSFVLNKNGLYYTSPIEWAASAMEMSVISAKNAVLLAFNNWNSAGETQQDPKMRNQKGEL